MAINWCQKVYSSGLPIIFYLKQRYSCVYIYVAIHMCMFLPSVFMSNICSKIYFSPINSCLSVLTPKVIGVAIARYDFSSRDTRELSLQEGDVVKIYTKSGANGWWRGEVNGRVSVTPTTASGSRQRMVHAFWFN